MQNATKNNLFFVSIVVNILLLIVLVVLLLFLPLLKNGGSISSDNPAEPGQDDHPPLNINEDALLDYAAEFNVSIEYLQQVLPDYFIYSIAGTYVFQPLNPALPRHGYQWQHLAHDQGRIYYLDSQYPNVQYGIDVSVYQGEIDWAAVAADGIDFAMIRIGYRGYGSGALAVDEACIANIEGALAAGLDIGAYFFSQAINEDEAIEEAELVLSVIRDYEICYPVVFDMEEIYEDTARTDLLSQAELSVIAKAFLTHIEDAGYQPMLYGNTKWLAARVDLEELSDYPIWFAQYHDKPLFPYDFAMWQYSSTGTVSGIAGDVDLNIFFGDYQQQ